MKRNTKLATILAAGAAAAVGGVLAAGPVAAAVGGNGGSTGPTPSTTSSYGRMMGGGSWGTGNSTSGSGGSGYSGMMGGSAYTGTGTGFDMMGASGVGMMGSIALTAPSGALSAAQKAALAGLAEQQQLGHDLYQAFADQYNSTLLDHVADAAAYQLDAVRTLMTRYGVSDPTSGSASGVFSDPAVQATYKRLLAQGQGGYANALQVLRTLEAAHTTTLTSDLNALSAPDARQAYTRMLALSEMYQSMLAQYAN
jgi:hypothetical protein